MAVHCTGAKSLWGKNMQKERGTKERQWERMRKRLECKREERMKDKINGLKDNFKEIIFLFFELMLKL